MHIRMKIEEIEIWKLIPYEFNNKIHDETQINRIANSIKEFWFLQPVVIDKNNIIIVWHGRVEGAKKLWLKKVPCIRAENLTETQIKKYRILDNKLNESAYNYDNIKMDLEEIKNFNIWEIELNAQDLFQDLLDPDDLNDDFKLPSGEKWNLCQITFTLAEEQKEMIEEAIKEIKETDLYKSMMTYWNENSNWNALSCIIEWWKALNP